MLRYGIAGIVLLLAFALFACVYFSGQSRKSIAQQVMKFDFSLILPMLGNFIVIISTNRTLSMVGYFMFHLGMDIGLVELVIFTLAYCRLEWKINWLKTLVNALICVDFFQLLLNPFLHHAFDLKAIEVYGAPYYQLNPFIGLYLHRVICYGIFTAAILTFYIKMVRSPGIYKERYGVIFLSLVLIGGWETFYVFSSSPIDRSMIGYGFFGLLVYYFALHYRPVRMLDRMLANIASDMNQAIYFFDVIGRCVWANRRGVELIGIDEDFEVASEKLLGLFPDLELTKEWNGERRVVDDGETRYYDLAIHTVRDHKGQKFGSFLTVYDQTEQQRVYLQEKHAAEHDSLTDLYSRDHLYECIREAIDGHPDKTYMICYLNIKNFKLINDIFGRDFGDYTLKCVADTLRRDMREGYIYGRVSGDTFGMCIPKDGFFVEVAETVLNNFIVRRGHIEYHVIMHKGVYEVRDRSLDVSIMFDRANMALESIKDDYSRHIAYYDDEMREKAIWDQKISEELERAIEEDQIRPYLQPIVDQNGRAVGAEALVRWIHPTEGFLSPARFVPVFERNGMIAQVDRHIWECACRILKDWKDRGIDDMFISINISPNDFYFIDVIDELRQLTWQYEIDPSRLRVEITETVMMADDQNRLKILSDLKNLGFIVEMDDFGSGYSSLNMLKDMPVDVIKIDMLFLRRSEAYNRSILILNNIMQLTRDLSISSITEGVETEMQYEILSNMGCQMFQGYYFAKPMPLEDFEKYMMENRKGGSL